MFKTKKERQNEETLIFRNKICVTPPYLISSEAVLSSALSQNSLPLFCNPASRNSPVDSSSIPAMSLQGEECSVSLKLFINFLFKATGEMGNQMQNMPIFHHVDNNHIYYLFVFNF